MDLPAYKADPKQSKFISLKSYLQEKGDQLQLAVLDMKIIPAEETQFGCTRLNLKVAIKEDGKKVEKTLEVDAPDEKNEFRGSQIYRGIKDNGIQPGDVIYIESGGKTRRGYPIYNVLKDVTAPAPKVHTEEEKPKEDISIDEIPF